MWRKIALFLGLSLSANAAQVDIYALNIKKEGDILEANSDVVIFSDFYFITANKAIYNEKTSEVELFGDVNILRGQNERSHSSYAKIKLDSKEANFENFFFSDKQIEVWFKSKDSFLSDEKLLSTNSIVSSCNVDDPDWEIRFSKGSYNKESDFVNLYNARLYIKSVPVFYLPYFGFSANTDRKTGLLIPKFVIKREEGLYYEQPIYFAYNENWDFQISPQIRTSRGFGAYSALRFMDSAYSSGELNFGAFRENTNYFHKENLRNQTHYGIELRYLRTDIFKDFLGDNYQEGLWIDGIYLNDVDYLNLGSRDYRDLTSLNVSQMNYFLADENNFYGAYAKYYIDTSKLSNADTLQEFPSFQYHRFLNSFLNEKITYSFDASFQNYYRKIGPYGNQSNFNLPISFHQSFFDDFLQMSFTESFYASLINYNKYPEKNNEHLFMNSHELNLFTSLSKPYDIFFHTLNLGVKYFLPGARSGSISQDYFNTLDEEEHLNFYNIQYFYNAQGEKKIKYRLDVDYLNKKNSFGDLENLISYYFNDNISLSNKIKYSQTEHRFNNIISQIDFTINDSLNWNFSHAYENDAYGKYSFISTRANYNINANYNLFGGIWFDTTRSHPNMWEVGYAYQRKCWNYSLAYRERIDPQLTSGGINAKTQSGFYFVFNFYPLGGVKYDLATQESESKKI